MIFRHAFAGLFLLPPMMLGGMACTVVRTTPVNPHPELTKALQSEAPYRCAVSCDVHEDFAMQGLEPEEARRRIEEHSAEHHRGATTPTAVQCSQAQGE